MRIGIISDIHEDIESLNKALVLLEKMGVDELVCLGDIVGFNTTSFNYLDRRNPAKCIAAVRENCSIVVSGNHDLFAIRKTPEHTAGFDFTSDWYALDFDERKQKGENHVWLYEETELPAMLGKKDYAYLESLPETARLETGKSKIFFSHYLFPDITGSKTVFTHPGNSVHLQYITDNNCNIGFSGHGHIEGVVCIGQNEITEPGFSKINIPSLPRVFIGPAIAEGKKMNGFLVFNSNELILECISL